MLKVGDAIDISLTERG